MQNEIGMVDLKQVFRRSQIPEVVDSQVVDVSGFREPSNRSYHCLGNKQLSRVAHLANTGYTVKRLSEVAPSSGQAAEGP